MSWLRANLGPVHLLAMRSRMFSEVIGAVVNGAMLLTIGLGLSYFMACCGAGMLELRAHRRSRDVNAGSAIRTPAGEHLYFLVPCLNESMVIGQTVAALLRTPNCTVVVIDDGSDDDTAAIATRVGGDRTTVVRRDLPQARQGKGQALNHGFAAVLADVRRTGRDPEQVFVCVMDADGRLSADAWAHVLPLFDDPGVGGVQLPVKIRTAGRLITRFQDLEFWAMSAVSQLGRRRSRTVSLGGNGQFTRLTALTALAGDPWSASLTEDLDLTITLACAGWSLDCTPSAWVDQQGVTAYRQLIRQRTRWFQGHMTAGRRLPEIWRNPRLTPLARLEITSYLAVPWLIVLPWSILSQIALVRWLTILTSDQPMLVGSLPRQVGIGLLMYLASFLPLLISGILYASRERGYGRLRSLALSHVMILWNYIAFIACWRALGNMLRGHTGWDKTGRMVEVDFSQRTDTTRLRVVSGATRVRRAGPRVCSEILLLVGTRPEAIKVAPVAMALADHSTLRPVIVHSGQHGDVVRQALRPFGLRPDIELAVRRRTGSQAELAAALLPALEQVMDQLRPAAVLVQGDTTTTFAGALAAFWHDIPLVHLEAGLRSGELSAPFPEEGNRQMVSGSPRCTSHQPRPRRTRCTGNEYPAARSWSPATPWSTRCDTSPWPAYPHPARYWPGWSGNWTPQATGWCWSLSIAENRGARPRRGALGRGRVGSRRTTSSCCSQFTPTPRCAHR